MNVHNHHDWQLHMAGNKSWLNQTVQKNSTANVWADFVEKLISVSRQIKQAGSVNIGDKNKTEPETWRELSRPSSSHDDEAGSALRNAAAAAASCDSTWMLASKRFTTLYFKPI